MTKEADMRGNLFTKNVNVIAFMLRQYYRRDRNVSYFSCRLVFKKDVTM